MMYTTAPWQAQVVRMLSYFFGFSITYFPGWIAASLILKFMLWKETSVGVILPYFFLAGLAAASQALMAGTLFRKAQLSGVVTGVVYILLGVLAQAVDVGTAGAVILGLLFTPSNMVLYIKVIARYEAAGRATNLLHAPEGSDHSLPPWVFWVFLVVQICICPLIAAWLERWLHGTASDSRIFCSSGDGRPHAVAVQGLTKVYRPSLLQRAVGLVSGARPATTAVDNLDLIVPHGQIVSLLGANGSGKSTTLAAIAGVANFDEGKIIIDGSGGVGMVPQTNVLYNELTTLEHVRLFNALKSPSRPSTDDELHALVREVGLAMKADVQASKLSGGQKRKLQLAMMLTGGSEVCLIDEVSSGLDPLSRQKIWEILLAERGKRTIILTTHFLDEAEQLSDHVTIMSQGQKRLEGSVVELKSRFGSGYRIKPEKNVHRSRLPEVEGAEFDGAVYLGPSSDVASAVIRELAAANISYSISSPTLENVFLETAEEYKQETKGMSDSHHSRDQPLRLLEGRPISMPRQTAVLMRKRLTLLKSNWLPYLIAVLLPVIAAAIMQLLIAHETLSTCTPVRLEKGADMQMYDDAFSNATILIGPESLAPRVSSLLHDLGRNASQQLVSNANNLRSVVEAGRGRIKPGGFADQVVVYRADEDFMASGVIAQNLLDSAHTGIEIVTTYTTFDSTFGSAGRTLQLSIYFAIALGIAPSFLSLYPCLERRSNVRSLQYSSGVRVFPLWLSHIMFDGFVMLLGAIIPALIFNFTSDAFWHAGYLVPVFILFTIAATLLGYIVSNIMSSQLASWAAVTAFNGVGLAVYFLSFVFIISLSDPTRAQSNIEIAHYVVAFIFPVGSLIRAMLVSLNVFSQACNGSDFISYPGAMDAYGAPILYLAIQIVLYFSILLLIDSKTRLVGLVAKKTSDPEKTETKSGVQVQGLTKKFDDLVAVDDVSFNVEHSEVFALLGPNGAGKSTTISLIRGDLAPTKGDVLVEQTSVSQNRTLARANMGVCPQFDAIDAMTTQEHLEHYARLRGILDVPRQVDAVISAVGLEQYRDTMAAALSGGNKRKLSLGMALTGNPKVILLDEPSSGLDAAAKRIVWKVLQTVTAGRSILLTTHSMEEADELANRAGILAQQMLATGTVENLRRVFGDTLHVHMVSRRAPNSSAEEMVEMRRVVEELFPEAEVEEKTYHGQMKFSVPTAAAGGTGQLLVVFEENKERLGVDHYSVAPTTLNDVFLAIVGRHQVEEEGYQGVKTGRRGKTWRKLLLGF